MLSRVDQHSLYQAEGIYPQMALAALDQLATVPVRWLARYRVLASSVAFFFVYDDGTLERLAGPER